MYTDNTYGTTSCTSDGGGNFPESCAVTADGSGVIYFTGVATGSTSTAGATYRVQI